MKNRPMIIAAVVLFAGLFAAGPANLAPGINEMCAGLDAMGDAWQLAFWNPGQQAGMSSSHSEQDMNIDMLNFHGLYLGHPVLARLDGPGVILRVWSAGASPSPATSSNTWRAGACRSRPSPWATGPTTRPSPTKNP